MRERLIGLLGDANDPVTPRQGGYTIAVPSTTGSTTSTGSLRRISRTPVGVVVSDEREAKAVAAVRERVNAMFADLGGQEFETYRSDPRWPGVQEAARQAFAMMEEPT